jgi:hypothetical protein
MNIMNLMTPLSIISSPLQAMLKAFQDHIDAGGGVGQDEEVRLK